MYALSMESPVNWAKFPAMALAVSLYLQTPAFGQSLPDYIAARYSGAIATWLSHHPEFRVAADADCSCTDDIAHVRVGNPPEWPPIPDYHLYYVVGDFRGDGAEEVAVGVISQQHPDKFRVLIIHGLPTKEHTAKTFLSEDFDLRQGLFYGQPRPPPWRLLVGPFESEGATFEPTHDGYRLSAEDTD